MKGEMEARYDAAQVEKVLRAENDFLKNCINDELLFGNQQMREMYKTGLFLGAMLGLCVGTILVTLIWALSL